MKIQTLLLCIILFSVRAVAQTTPSERQQTDSISPRSHRFEPHNMGLRQPASFPGGEAALLHFIAENVKYPVQARRDRIEGNVVVSFIVNIDGTLSDIIVLRGLGGGCDEACISAVKSMPNWQPAQSDGKPILSQYTLPIKFRL